MERGKAGQTSPDKRGKTLPKNKTSKEMLENVKEHIRSFPAYESHYNIRDTSAIWFINFHHV